MTFETVTEQNMDLAAEIHAISWQESHKSFCTAEFIRAHTPGRQREYIRQEMACGKQFFLLVDGSAKGIVSVKDNLIENLYVLPSEQRKGYGSALLQYAQRICIGLPTLWILSNNTTAKTLHIKRGCRFTGKEIPRENGLRELEMQFSGSSRFLYKPSDI